MKFVYVYVLDTLSDWEPGHALAELNSGQYFKNNGQNLPVRTVGASRGPVVTSGGLTITPDTTPDEITPENTALLMLIGADTWHETQHVPIVEKAGELLAAGANVAAICGATAVLANAGLLDERPHTSNAPQYPELMAQYYQHLPYFKGYKGHAHYKPERAIADGNLITASSAGPLLWAKYIIARLDVFSDEALEAWYQYYSTGDAKYFFELMQAVPQAAPGSPS